MQEGKRSPAIVLGVLILFLSPCMLQAQEGNLEVGEMRMVAQFSVGSARGLSYLEVEELAPAATQSLTSDTNSTKTLGIERKLIFIPRNDEIDVYDVMDPTHPILLKVITLGSGYTPSAAGACASKNGDYIAYITPNRHFQDTRVFIINPRVPEIAVAFTPQILGDSAVSGCAVDAQGDLWISTIGEVVVYSKSALFKARFREADFGTGLVMDIKARNDGQEMFLAVNRSEKGQYATIPISAKGSGGGTFQVLSDPDLLYGLKWYSNPFEPRMYLCCEQGGLAIFDTESRTWQGSTNFSSLRGEPSFVTADMAYGLFWPDEIRQLDFRAGTTRQRIDLGYSDGIEAWGMAVVKGEDANMILVLDQKGMLSVFVHMPDLVPIVLSGNRPLFPENGVVSAASNLPTGLAPGGLVSIYGQYFTDEGYSCSAKAFPLPTKLCNVWVEMNTTLAPLLYVGPGQINLQLPTEQVPGGQVKITVWRQDGFEGNVWHNSLSIFSLASATAPALFVSPQGFTACGQNIAGRPIVTHLDGTLVTPCSPTRPGETVTGWATGLGRVSPEVGSGLPAPIPDGNTPLSVVMNLVEIEIGGVKARVWFAGLAPGFAGLYQINFESPSGLGSGDKVLVIKTDGKVSPQYKFPVGAGS